MRTIESYQRSSLLYWWPKIKDLGIPVPKTLIYEIPKEDLRMIRREEGISTKMADQVKPLAKQLGYPLFMKTDQAAGKHDWNSTCYVANEETLQRNILGVIEANLNADILGLPFEALVLREYFPLESTFTAFHGQMPVAKERRYFIRDGQIECHHFYWPEAAIAQWASYSENEKKLPKNWKELLKKLNTETNGEKRLLSNYALKVAKVLDGWWSVDFAKTKDGGWILIDMADGAMSFHDIECKYCPEEIKQAYTEKPKERPDVVTYKEQTESFKRIGDGKKT